ncbi:MAG TPA: OmpA family protein [Paludibacter sp.]|nr:OmpA family protein [Paludibacter sp.]
MKKLSFIMILSATLLMIGCSALNKTQKGAIIGTTGGGAAGAVIGRAAGNTALGAIIGAAVGGASGAIIGHQMDKQADEIAKTVPDAKVVRVGEGIVVEFSSNVLFGFDQSNLSTEARTNLDKLVKILDGYADTNIEIQGHTDSKGSLAYNKTLSQQRAAAVSNYLNSKNISGNRLSTVGFGETLPKYQNETETGRSQNRRVEFLITANEKMKAEAEKQAGK